MIEQLKTKIVELFRQNPHQVFKAKEVARRLSVRDEEGYQALRQALRELQSSKKIQRAKGNRYSYPSHQQHLIGKLSVNKQGYGFVELEGNKREEIFISPKFTGTALDGDLVAVSLFATPLRRSKKTLQNEKKVEGEIVEVLQRGRKTIVGRLEKSKNFYFVIPDDPKITRDLYIPKESLHGARHGDKVVTSIVEWESAHLNPEGNIVEVLGKSGDAQAEVLSIARAFDLPVEFPKEVLQETKEIPATIPAEEYHSRLDLREKICFTIDPEDAKDFDDAVSLEFLKNGKYRLGVHIADVSHFVKEGSALDREALRRGTSVYLVNEVIPMLPEKLSNEVCSLKPHEDRLTYSVLMTVNEHDVLEDYEIRKTVIDSNRRFTYEEAQRIIDTGRGDFADVLQRMHHLSKQLTRKRMREGSIDFESPEAKFRFDEEGIPIEIIKKVRLDSHRLIEEFMLLANQTVAKHIGFVRDGVALKPFVYRVHDLPDPTKLKDLASFVANFGHKLQVDGIKSRAIQKLIEQVRGTEEEYIINDVAIRSMAKAIYSEKNIGHFGLGFKYYTHFTSPIRRYPDLIVHRLLKEYGGQLKNERQIFLEKRLPGISLHCSEMERRAIEAERESIKVKQVEYMERHLGDEFHGIVSGVTNFGLFIEISDLLVEGMVRVRDMRDDYYVYDEKKYALIGRHTRKQYRLGAKVQVQVVRVDMENREIDFALVD